jgi:LDH2 family malate/lactate/ureidoglycolate dehydrogenase
MTQTVQTAQTARRLVQAADHTSAQVRVDYHDLLSFVTDVLTAHDLPPQTAALAAEALCYGDLTGFASHGVANLARLYLPLLESNRCDPRAAPVIVNDRGASVLLDARRALGLWAAAEAMDLAVERAAEYGVGLVSVRGGTHFGCAGYHASRAARRSMVGLVTANCGRQRLAPPVGGRDPMLGTNPLSLAAPAGELPPFVLDMSTTVVPTGKVRAAARDGRQVPYGWLEDDAGEPVTDPAAFDRGEARLRWLGGQPETGAYKGFGLALLVEVLSALVPGAGVGPRTGPGEGQEPGSDDDIGYLTLAIAPGRLRGETEFLSQSQGVFDALLRCVPARADQPVSYPGLPEARRAAQRLRTGVPLSPAVHRELLQVAREHTLRFPEVSRRTS